MALEIKSGASADIATVDPTSKALRATLYDTAGSSVIALDDAVVPAIKGGFSTTVNNDGIYRTVRGDVTGGYAQARYLQLFLDMVDGAAVNPQMWTAVVSGMTITQATRIVTMNAANSVTISNHALHTSLRQFVKPRGTTLRYTGRHRFSWQASGAVIEVGFMNPATSTAAVPNGAFLRVTSAGDVVLVLAYNSSETTSGVLATIGAGAGQINPASWYDVDIIIDDDDVKCVVQRSDQALSVAELPVVNGQLRFATARIAEWNAISSPIGFRVYNSTAPSTASQFFYSGCAVQMYDLDSQKPYADQLAASMRSTLMNPATGAQLANYANNAVPATGALSNTVPSYTTLGGQWQFAAPAGAETDNALFGFTVPAGRTLHVTGVKISSWNTVVAVATTATVMQWSVGRAAAATAATNSFRWTIGAQSFPVGAAVGALAADVEWIANTPLVVDSGQVFHVLVKVPIGTATATEIFRGVCLVEGYFE